METQLTHISTDGVSINASAGEWHVSVRENGRKAVVSFLIEHHAISFAEGQRTRIKLGSAAG